MRKVLLVILDGWGHSDFGGEPDPGNAIELADVPRFRSLFDDAPRTRIACSGEAVGLPVGQMGNSEVGHLNLGAGRIVYQDIARIDLAIDDGTFSEHLGLDALVEGLRTGGGMLHLVGLVSDGGVHAHSRHFTALLDLLPEDLDVRVHCITDGRDTSPTGGRDYVAELDASCARSDRWAVASVTGRYWAMDRDRRWDRTRRAYDLIARGEAEAWADDPGFLARSYEEGVTDEFVPPTGIRGVGERGIREEDVVLLMNFRADRMRQLTEALSRPDFDGFERKGTLASRVVTMTEYEPDLPVAVAFPPENVKRGLSEYLAERGKTQLKVAETEKYAHVTYFFNGGEETACPGEDRTVVPSPQVSTYDLQPEMSATEVEGAVSDGIRGGTYDFILVNFANPDMVGHTGSIPAAVAAVEAVDGCLGRLLDLLDAHPEWVALVTADHGNAEKMLGPDGSPFTAHTKEPVDFLVYDPRGEAASLREGGRLADVAPTVLSLMALEQPEEMTGTSLLAEQRAAG
ncbi:MAG: 2,3-bisphosphoglycerate-independent phosphoglycerate mutase [Gemmatimonadota bacterium]|nr:2,3-bisphosphoglycerate-independent phosphoglycerate mutase [Gemmatimonadota bacterium]